MPVLFDGWALAYAPSSPAALHCIELINALPDGVNARIALPAARADGSFAPATPIIQAVPNTALGKLRWEQSVLGRLVSESRAAILHTTGSHAPLFAPCPVLVSPAEDVHAASISGEAAGRLRSALGKGGFSSARCVLWPEDFPAPGWKAAVRRIPPFTHSLFSQPLPRPAHLPENYVLSAGLMQAGDLDLLAAAWSWAISGLGQDWTLLVAGLDDGMQAAFLERCRAAGTAESVQFAAPHVIQEFAGLMQHASAALLTGTPTAWGDAYLQALASGTPIAAQERAWEDARVGAAGYLAAQGDARALGAAVLTIIVEAQVGENLRAAALQRSAGWQKAAFQDHLTQVYAEAAPEWADALLTARQQDIAPERDSAQD